MKVVYDFRNNAQPKSVCEQVLTKKHVNLNVDNSFKIRSTQDVHIVKNCKILIIGDSHA